MKTTKFQNFEIRETGNNAAVYVSNICIAVINIETSEIAFKTISMKIEEISALMDFVNDFYGSDSETEMKEYAVFFDQGWNSVYATSQEEAEKLAREKFEGYEIRSVKLMTPEMNERLMSLFN